MQPNVIGTSERRALLFGGTGAVGGAVLKQLAQRGVTTRFTYCRSREKANVLALEYGAQAVQVDFSDAAATLKMLTDFEKSSFIPNTVIFCAGRAGAQDLAEVSLEDWQATVAIHAQATFLTCQWIARVSQEPCDIVFVGGLDRTQSLPLPVPLAASQGMLNAMTMALAHELGPRGFRVNMVALGILSEGLSQTLNNDRRKQYETFSALRRVGTPAEAAKTIVWLALENSFIHGKTLAVNGGI